MKGAIFFSGKYGSTEQYGQWISKATGLPVFDIKDPSVDPAKYDFLVLGSSILYFRLSNRKWIKENLDTLEDRAKVLFSVSGAGPGKKLERWVVKSVPVELLSKMEHIALRGKLDHSKVSWMVKIILWMGSLFNSSSEGRRDERYGFDYMDKSSIEPIVKLVQRHQAKA